MKKYIWGIIYGILLCTFTVYLLLDTFVITRVYKTVSQNEETKTNIERTSGIWTDNSYSDDNISINIEKYREYETEIYVADIKISSPEYLKTALAENSFGKLVCDKTSKIAADVDAILAINGDFYGARENGCVLRNGILYRDASSKEREDLIILKDGSFEIKTEKSIAEQPDIKDKAQQILSFGPALVMDGEVSVTSGEEVKFAKSSNQRTAIGIIDNLHYLFVVSDGRTSESKGLSLNELAEFMKSLGANIAYNLDGGGSSTMIFNGQIINKPTWDGQEIKEREVSDIVYIGY